MATLRSSYDAQGLFDDEVGIAIRRKVRQTGGIAVVAAAAMAGIALATWSVNDQSLSHATSAPIRNLMGFPGAAMADIGMQLFGLAAVAPVLTMGAWGWRMITDRPIGRHWWRVMAGVWALLFACACVDCLPKTTAWPLPTGLGGVVGDAVLRAPAWLGLPLTGSGRVAAALLFLVAAAAAGFIGCGFGLHAKGDGVRFEDESQENDDDRGWGASVSIGWMVHGLLSIKTRLTLLARGLIAARLAEPEARATPGRRVEPTFGTPRSAPRVELKPTERSAPSIAPVASEYPSPDRHDPEQAEPTPQDDDEPDDEPDDEADNATRGVKVSAPAPAPKAAVRPAAKAASKKSGGGYDLPSLNLLAAPKASDRHAPSVEAIQEAASSLETVLDDFGVRGEIINARPGPVVTLYELEPAPGIKSSRVINLSDDIARSMSAVSARVAVVSGRNVIGIELPNQTREKVYLRELLSSQDYVGTAAKLPLCLGKTIGGEAVIADLARMPHLLIAGTTGSGKSVGINTMILSLLYRLRPDQCRLIMVDPKMLELSVYDGIPHLLTPVVTDPKKAVVALKWAVREMEDRYKKMAKLGVRNIDGYNERVAEAKQKNETLSRTVHTGYDRDSGEAVYETEEFELEALPYLVVIVDEMADLMMVAGKDIEGAIQRLAQMARAAGIHVILATQRPSVDVITGTIKANFPTRISFQVTSKIDSRTILGEQGAEQLLGQGDMLHMAGGGRISRVHGPFVSDDEVEKIVRHLKSQGVPQYLEDVTVDDSEEGGGDQAVFDATGMGAAEGGDPYAQAVQVVMRDRKASTSYIQRRLQIGYNRAASIMERMEKEGIVGQANHAGKREILVGEENGERY